MLKPDAALRKDRTTTATLEHRHFAEIARIIAGLDGANALPLDAESKRRVAKHFASGLRYTNPRFDRDRFLRACGV